MTRDRLAYLRAESARGPLTQVEVGELLDAVEQSFGAVDAECVASARLLYEMSNLRSFASKSTKRVNVALLCQIEAETFRWAAQLVENPNREAILELDAEDARKAIR